MEYFKEIAKKQGIFPVNVEIGFWENAIPLIHKIQKDGATFFIKADGERKNNIFTIMIFYGNLNDEYIRCETDDIVEGVKKVISEYAQIFWK